eukprot:TRINITY_DN534_c0_g1_i1.p1 TRINITY_DN534_c0_g1~~TRINITY_DN534_c0_g1_i1.p1  ORF type:complete len:512 (-),score=166.66 TRINITY_DN534_c0_g1_i1:9-1544(-)
MSGGPLPLSSDAQASLQQTVEDFKQLDISNDSFEQYYDVDASADFIKTNGFKNIALQFPDALIGDSTRIAELLQTKTGYRPVILGDTSYGACCIDEVAGEHSNADVILHYGPSCLSKPSRTSVFHVFGRGPIDTAQFTEEVTKAFPDVNARVIIFSDVLYYHAMEEIKSQLRSKYPHFIFPTIQRSVAISPSKPSQSVNTSPDSCGNCDCNTTTITASDPPQDEIPSDSASTETEWSGRRYDIGTDDISTFSIIYIGSESSTLRNLIMTFNKNEIWTFDPPSNRLKKQSLQTSKNLMKRYYLVQQAKDAQVIGILAGTLGVARYLEVIQHLKDIIKKAGKKSYTFVVGKLNVPKLANFGEIDLFVLVACPENSMIDSGEFYRPIVTPFELEIALVRGKEWTGEYRTDFSQILPGLKVQDEIQLEDQLEEEEETRFSLITGTLKPNHKAFNLNSSTSQEISARSTQELSEWTPAGNFLREKTFLGLEPKLGETPVVKAVSGRSGIPMKYDEE